MVASKLKHAFSPTRLSKLANCSRYIHISQQFHSSHPASAPLILGSAAHEVFRHAAEMSKSTWKNSADISTDIAEAAAFACNDTLESIKINSPEFLIDGQRMRPFWQQWITTWLQQRASIFTSLVNDGMTPATAIADALPLTEVELKSDKFDIYGRADQVYQKHNNQNGKVSIHVTDLKTDERLTSYISEQSHQIQLVCYAVMAEETLHLPCEEVGILYLKNMQEQKFKVTKEAKSLVKDLVEQYKMIVSAVNPPPLLTGLEAEMKCPRCPLKKQCYRLAEMNGEI